MSTATVQTSELLDTEGFVGQLIIQTTDRVFVAEPDGTVSIESDEPRTLKIADIVHAFPLGEFGTFEMMAVDADGMVEVFEPLHIHEIESMLVGPCDPECADCASLREEG